MSSTHRPNRPEIPPEAQQQHDSIMRAVQMTKADRNGPTALDVLRAEQLHPGSIPPASLEAASALMPYLHGELREWTPPSRR